MRAALILLLLPLTLAVHAVTPEAGKEKLRLLARLPTATFQPNWAFDPELGFTLGANHTEALANVARLEEELRGNDGDAALLHKIGDLYSSSGQKMNARSYWLRAGKIYHKRLEQEPENAVLLAENGLILNGLGKPEEAESLLRRATGLAPKEWRCWVALGRFLDSTARREVRGNPKAAKLEESGGKTEDVYSPDQVALSEKRSAEAGVCFDKAVALAPEEAEVYYRRGLHRCLRVMLRNQLRSAAGGFTTADLYQDCFSPESLADVQRASRLSPKNYQMIGSAALFEVYAAGAKNGLINWPEFNWDTLPDQSRRSLRESITRLEDLSQNPESRVAAGALEVLGLLQGDVLHSQRNSVMNLRRAVSLDPERKQAWEMLAGELLQSGNPDELLAVSEERVKREDTGRSHFLLAKTFERLKQWENAEEQVFQALHEEPYSFQNSLALAAVLLRKSQIGTNLADANNWLSRADILLQKMPATEKNRQQAVDYTLTKAIYLALSDETATAKEWVKAVLAQDKDNKYAQEILAAMDY